MPDNSHIYIFTGPIQSGKTSRLFEWLKSVPGAGGFLTPDINGRRKLLDIASHKLHPFEVDDTYAGSVVSVGKFRFSKAVFDKGKEMIGHAAIGLNWLVIDEVGKLEIEQGEGFEPEIIRIVKRFQKGTMTGNLLLVIRDTLLLKAMDKYALEGAILFNTDLPI
jgi:nucleoside-triphosphatase THEP1